MKQMKRTSTGNVGNSKWKCLIKMAAVFVTIGIWFFIFHSYNFKITQPIPSTCSIDNTIASAFDKVYEKRVWGGDSKTTSRSGWGSVVDTNLEWIKALNTIITTEGISTVADFPCGDLFWQFGSRSLNIVDVYVCGDIAKEVIKINKRDYDQHGNKFFVDWDLTSCKLPTVVKNKFQTQFIDHFDLVIIKHVIQHLPVHKGMKFLKNVVLSKPKFIMVTSHPCNILEDQSVLHKISAGGFFKQGMDCPPFNFPKPWKVIQNLAAKDLIHIYKVDEKLTKLVQTWDL